MNNNHSQNENNFEKNDRKSNNNLTENSTSLISNSKINNINNTLNIYFTTNEDLKRKRENSYTNLTEKTKSLENTYFRIKFNENENNFFIFEKAYTFANENILNSIKTFKYLNEGEIEELNIFLQEFFTKEEEELKENFLFEGLKIEALIDELYELYEDHLFDTSEKNQNIKNNNSNSIINLSRPEPNNNTIKNDGYQKRLFQRSYSENKNDINLKCQEDFSILDKKKEIEYLKKNINKNYKIENFYNQKYLSENNLILNKIAYRKFKLNKDMIIEENSHLDLNKKSSINLFTNYSSFNLESNPSFVKLSSTKELQKCYRITIISNYYIYSFKYTPKNNKNKNDFRNSLTKKNSSNYLFSDSRTNTYSNNLIIENCTLEKKLEIRKIEYFILTTDYSKLLIHINNNKNTNTLIDSNDENFKLDYENLDKEELQSKVNFENKQTYKDNRNLKNARDVFYIFNKDNNFYYMTCLSNILRNIFSSVKPVIFIPHSEFNFFKLNKNNLSFSNVCNHLNQYSIEFFNKLIEFLPKDKEEKLIKFITLNKIEDKFIELKKKKILFITNKKLVEIDEENLEYNNLNFILFSKIEMINVSPNKNKFEILYSNNKSVVYFTYNFLNLVKLIKDIYNRDCLIPLPIKKKM